VRFVADEAIVADFSEYVGVSVSATVTPIPSVHSCIIIGTSAAAMLRSFSHHKNDAITTMTIIIIIIITIMEQLEPFQNHSENT
jgi:hypothetical protein